MINLISDTVTKPTPEMLSFMMKAEVGDDVFREDPTVNKLEERVAAMFGKEAAIFCPSGTMTNQIAIKVNTQPIDDVICDVDSHIYQSETGGYAYNSGVGISLIYGQNGKITATEIKTAIKPGHDWQPTSKKASDCILMEPEYSMHWSKPARLLQIGENILTPYLYVCPKAWVRQ